MYTTKPDFFSGTVRGRDRSTGEITHVSFSEPVLGVYGASGKRVCVLQNGAGAESAAARICSALALLDSVEAGSVVISEPIEPNEGTR